MISPNRSWGREAGDLLWEDGLGAGVQIALFDAVGKSLNTPAYRLLGTKTPRVVSALLVGDGHASERLGATMR